MSHYPAEPEFEQAYGDLVSALSSSNLFQNHPQYRTALTVVKEPERVFQFRVLWEDDSHQVQVNRGYRVQFNSTLGPYKGGTRFHPTVNLSVLKMLAMEQTFKNALTGYHAVDLVGLGGAKGGSDFDPKGKSEAEIRRFCIAYMRELSKHIGANTDIPAGDIGVTAREIGWMFGTYKAETSLWEGCITGKSRNLGGSLMKPKATGYGLIYYVHHMVTHATAGSETLRDKKIAISGSGNVAQYAALKAVSLGAIIVSLSDSKGCIIATDPQGISSTDLGTIINLKKQRKQLHDLQLYQSSSLKYIESARPWQHLESVDIALPCATQNELFFSDAQHLLSSGCRYVAEGSNMGCSADAIQLFESSRLSCPHQKGKACWFAPGKAANLGGSAVSGLEMVQNSQRASWSAEEVDGRLREIMERAFKVGVDTAGEFVSGGEEGPEDGRLPSLLAGSNIAGFVRVVEVMREVGDWW